MDEVSFASCGEMTFIMELFRRIYQKAINSMLMLECDYTKHKVVFY